MQRVDALPKACLARGSDMHQSVHLFAVSKPDPFRR